MNFEELCLDTRILRAITEMGFEQASPIQAQAIPVAIEGKDMIGQAQTGTGKIAGSRALPDKRTCDTVCK